MLAILLCAGLAPELAAAQGGEPRNGFLPNVAAQRDRDVEPDREQAEPQISPGRASEIAQQSFSGKVISISLVNQRWRVRIDQDGRVVDVFVDAETGRITRPSDGN